MAYIKLLENLDRIPPLDSRLQYIKSCTRCSLSPHLGQNPGCKQVVVGSGNLQSRVLLIFAAPAQAENEYGFPIVGPSNFILDWLENLGLKRYEDYFITNAVMCMLPSDRDGMDVKKKELDACAYNLSQIIDLMPNLKLIVWFGQPAARATEGRETTISARLFNIGKIEWIPATHYFKKSREFLTFGLYHPAFLLRKKGKELEYYEKKYKASLFFITEVIKNHLDDIEKFEHPKNYLIAETPTQALDWAKKHLHDNRVKAYSIDFETLGRWRCFNLPIGIAIGYENPETDQIESFWTYFLQRIKLPKSEWKSIRLGKHKGHHTEKYKWESWHYDTFEQEFMGILQGLFDIDGYRPAGRDKPMVTAWNNGAFESLIFKNHYGFNLCGSDAQMGLEAYKNEVMPFDMMAAFRQVSNGNSMKLASILELMFPLLHTEKEPAHELILNHFGSHELDVSGYGCLSIKIPSWTCREEVYEKGRIYNDWLAELKHESKKKIKKEVKKTCPLPSQWLEFLEDAWSPDYSKLFCDVLAERACFDSFTEYKLWSVYTELINNSDEFAAEKFAKKEFDTNFFDERWIDTFQEKSELDFSPQY